MNKMQNSAQTGFYRKLSKPRDKFLLMLLFLIFVGFIVATLFEGIKEAFWQNPALNSVIFATLGIGILYSFARLSRLYPEIKWVNNYSAASPGVPIQNMPVLLAPTAMLLRDRAGGMPISTSSMSSLLDSIASRLEESKDTSRYLIGLLVFLGLLGTFWGLLDTVGSVGKVISALNPGNGGSGDVFAQLQSGLEKPLKGMGTAFSSSLFGLSGSLILGFMDLQTSQAQNRFYNELEEWLSGITELTTTDSGDGSKNELRFALLDLQRSLSELGDRIQYGLDSIAGRSDESSKELARGIDNLVKQMRAEQKVVREWVDEQAAHTSDLNVVLRELNARLGRRGN